MNTTEVQLRYNDTEYMKSPHGFCSGCGVVLALRYFIKVMGEKVVIVMPPGCASPGVLFPTRSLVHENGLIDTVACPFGSTAIFAGGIKTALLAKGNDETEVIGWAGDGATFDIGFGGVSAAAERNEDFIYVCYDNEGYQNTGNQRSSASPWQTINTTNPSGMPKMEFKKDIMSIMAAHASADIAPVPESVSRSMMTSSARS